MPPLRDKSGCRTTVDTLAVLLAVALVVLVAACNATAQDAAPTPAEPAAVSETPSITARPHAPHEWTTAGGLRCQWSIPPNIRKGQSRDLVVILHGTGLDYRWGFANHDPGTFRPDDFVFSVDGTSAGMEKSRLFLGREQDVNAFAAFLEEIEALLPVRRVFLYGHSQGGFFALYFAGERPDLVDGVVAHGSGIWAGTKADNLAGVPVVFMHGSADPVVPYTQSTGARDALAARGHERVQVRRLDRYNHWPNADRASECLDWCVGMRTDDPAECLSRARALLTPKPKDQYGFEAPAWFSGASDLLCRIIGRHAQSFTPAAPDLDNQRKLARPLLEAVEAHAALHVAALRESVKTRDGLGLTGAPWLGHLTAFREDFRGIRPAEDYIKAIGYDEAAAEHRRAAVELTQAWYRRAGGRETFSTIVRVLPRCFLADGLPAEMDQQVPAWFKDAAALNLSTEAVRDYRYFLMYQSARDPEPYRAIWSRWKPP